MIGKETVGQLLALCAVGAIILIGLPAGEAGADHTYPRTGIFQWGGAPADWYARFDLVDFGSTSSDLVRDIKAISPDTLVLNTVDFNAGAHLGGDMPDECRMKTSGGSDFGWYAGVDPSPDQISPNLSDVCPSHEGTPCNLWFAGYVTSRFDLEVFDGIATDGLYCGPHMSYSPPADIDLDRNEVNDFDEHGHDWVVEHWHNGVGQFLSRVREIVGPGKAILVNSGVAFDAHNDLALINGAVLEYYGCTVSWEYERGRYMNFMEISPEPHVALFSANPGGEEPNRPDDDKNYFTFMRFTLVKTMMGDGYFCYEPRCRVWGEATHYYNYYYDEFDLDIGTPTTGMLKLGDADIWVRFFDRGAAIVNISGEAATVTDEDLQALDGYGGPYHRFRGGQDPAFNNGEPFDEVELMSEAFVGYGDATYIEGDGIVLVSEPTVAVADIIIDNDNNSTSPGSEPPDLDGWTLDSEGNRNGNYSVRAAPHLEQYAFAYNRDMDGGEQVVYAPTIGLAGSYEVLEWHGSLRDGMGTAATNVPYAITHGGGAGETGTIDQTADTEQWNSLGIFEFDEGAVGNVTMTNDADGTVIADAFKFVFQAPVVETEEDVETAETAEAAEPAADMADASTDGGGEQDEGPGATSGGCGCAMIR
ncbi:MAG: hypothetical protein KJ956_14615 [Actinobacteria bacterium]|nr:hypothetical protein [Actinomycetota bacterium]